ncbi:MAG: aspartate--ammonia ligase [Clostridia bacterium]|nr:aspartate--ammonia ligase [Clostridia bacterium]
MFYEIDKKEYRSLKGFQTQRAIKYIKDTFQQHLSKSLNLLRVSAPLFVTKESGLNDDLSGIEKKVEFEIKTAKTKKLEIVQSLAKWKRMALKKYGFWEDSGLYTDMNAIRKDEDLDQLHSVYVDQWDWEKVITRKDRTIPYLKKTVTAICDAIDQTCQKIKKLYKKIDIKFKKKPFFITSEELLQLYPDLTPKQREDEICKKHKTVFIMQIGDKLSNGEPHDGRAPDYDDWQLNGDLLVYNPVLHRAFELSSMGIRVDSESLQEQLKKAQKEEKLKFQFHKDIIADALPLSIGGGIGQSRLCMYILKKGHIGEVQCSIWDDENLKFGEENGLTIL